jgi:Tol biopolymer transport system component
VSLFTELKRRNVIRVGLAYAVVAWFIVQAADILLGNFEAPTWVFKSVTSLLALGFPLVLLLSWVYELTPAGIQKTDDADATGAHAPAIGLGIRRALMAGLVLLALAAAWLSFRPADEPPDDAARAGHTRAPTSTSSEPAAPLRGLRLSIPLPDGLEVTDSIAISRDGSRIGFAAASADGERHVYLRRLDDFAPIRVEGSHEGVNPFFSPDGTSIGFFARGAIWRAATQGGPPTRLRAVPGLTGADWLDDDTIAYSVGLGSVIQRMSADGTELDPITTLQQGDYAHVWPQQAPGTDRLLFTSWGANNSGGAFIVDLASGISRSVASDTAGGQPARWSASGHVLFENFSDGVFATRFDPASSRSVSFGGARFLLGDVHHLGSTTRSVFALAENGTFAYVPAVQNDRRLVRIHADGVIETLLDQGGIDYATLGSSIAISRDGRLAVIGSGDIIVVDLERKLPRRLASDGNDLRAVFGPDEREVYYGSNREDRWKVWKRPIDDSAPPTTAVEHAYGIDSFSLGPDGGIAFSVTDPTTRGDIWWQDAAGTQRALLQTGFSERQPAVSPDGGWLAYVADVGGSNEVYLLRASGQGVPVQVSSGGGGAPRWSPDGRALLYRKGRTILQVAIDDGRPVGEPVQRFVARRLVEGSAYALASDGDSLLAVQLGDAAIPREIRVITDFFDEIRRVTDEDGQP